MHYNICRQVMDVNNTNGFTQNLYAITTKTIRRELIGVRFRDCTIVFRHKFVYNRVCHVLLHGLTDQ